MDDNQFVYLCQVSETVSCGACCGLYNLPDLSRPKVEDLLARRTEEFASVPRTEEDIFRYKKRNRPPHKLSRPFPQFHHCPFLGFRGDRKRTVACLLHPSMPGNDGADYRSLSWYGEQACRTYFCPSNKKLPAVYKSILIRTIDNWYDFGLIVTEHSLLNGFFQEVECRLGRSVVEADFTANGSAAECFREFAGLKSNWPFRRHDAPGPCNFFFENGMYARAPVHRGSTAIPQSFYEQILMELDSGFSTLDRFEAAEKYLDDLFTRTERALAGS